MADNLKNALYTWNSKLSEIMTLLSCSPEEFKGGTVWAAVSGIHGALRAVAYALLVLFFLAGVMKTCGSFAEMKRPEIAVKLFVRFALAKAAVTYGMDILMAIMEIARGITGTVIVQSGLAGPEAVTLPERIGAAIGDCGFWEMIPLWAVTLLGSLFITVISFYLILTVYGRFFRIYMYAAAAPLALSTFAGEPTQVTGRAFLRAFAGVMLEGAVIAAACLLFSAFASSGEGVTVYGSPVTVVWTYIGEVIFNMLLLTGCVKASGTMVRELLR